MTLWLVVVSTGKQRAVYICPMMTLWLVVVSTGKQRGVYNYLPVDDVMTCGCVYRKQRGVYNYLPVDDVMTCGCVYRKTAWSVYLPVADVIIVIVSTRRQLSVHLCSFFFSFLVTWRFVVVSTGGQHGVLLCLPWRRRWRDAVPTVRPPVHASVLYVHPVGVGLFQASWRHRRKRGGGGLIFTACLYWLLLWRRHWAFLIKVTPLLRLSSVVYVSDELRIKVPATLLCLVCMLF